LFESLGLETGKVEYDNEYKLKRPETLQHFTIFTDQAVPWWQFANINFLDTHVSNVHLIFVLFRSAKPPMGFLNRLRHFCDQ
jgi:hypothetical protein